MNDLPRFMQHRYLQRGMALILVLIVAGGVFALQGDSNALVVSTTDLDVDPSPDSLAPDFTLMSINGESLSLSQFRGQPVLINFWATWCGPCRIEMPAIQSRYELFREDGLVVLAVDFDESAQTVADFKEEFGLTFELLLDPGAEIQKLYRNRSYPTSFFVDSLGVIQVQHIGVMTEGQLDSYLQTIGLGV